MNPKLKEEPKKLCVLLAGHVGEPRGGVSTYYETLLNSNLKDYVDLHFVETSRGFLQPGNRGKWKLINWIDALGNILRFVYALIVVKPDLVHIGTAYGASLVKHSAMVYAARLFFIPVIIQPHCNLNKVLPDDKPQWAKVVLYTLHQCNGIIVLSQEWQKLSSLIPEIKLCYIPNAIDVKPYKQLARPRNFANGKVNILFMGHITREKGIFDLIQAILMMIKENKNFAVNIVGEYLNNAELNSVNKMIISNNLQKNVKIHGPEYYERQINRFASSDIFVLPSYHEGMPMSIIEAMASGLPVVASNVGGIPDLITDQETGKLIDPGDVKSLASTLLGLINHPDKRLNMGMVGRQKAIEQFDINKMTKKLASFYEAIMSRAN